MNKLKIFDYAGNQVRTIQKDGEPWFVLKDVCAVLKMRNSRMVADRLDDDEKGVSQTDTLGGAQEMTIINESGLYHVILRSDKPEAKPFRRWVTSEVLPSIRRTGGYIAGQEQMTPEELMAKALVVAQRTIADRDARISTLIVENQIMAPKAEYFDELVDRNLLTNFRETAKQLGIPPKKFTEQLLAHKYIYRDKRGKLLPYEGKNNGYFEVKETYNEKTAWSGTQTLHAEGSRSVPAALRIEKSTCRHMPAGASCLCGSFADFCTVRKRKDNAGLCAHCFCDCMPLVQSEFSGIKPFVEQLRRPSETPREFGIGNAAISNSHIDELFCSQCDHLRYNKYKLIS